MNNFTNIIYKICLESKKTTKIISTANTKEKNNALKLISKSIINNTQKIIEANNRDMKMAKESNLSDSILDRLMLNKSRIKSMSEGLIEISKLYILFDFCTSCRIRSA